MQRVAYFVAVLLLAGAQSLPAIKIGDAAPSLAIKEWVKSSPVDVRDGKKLYVVEFWATWCGPCRLTIPNLTELQKKFAARGVTIVGISDEAPETVKPFVANMAGRMDYVVACDNEARTKTNYMSGFSQIAIPWAFVVSKQGKVLWHGHPLFGLEKAIEEILAGTYDLTGAIQQDAIRARRDEFMLLSMMGDARAKALGKQVIADFGTNAAGLMDLAFNLATTPSPQRELGVAFEALDQAEKLLGKPTGRLLVMRSIVLFESGQQEAGLALAKKGAAACTDPQERTLYENGVVRVMQNRMTAGAVQPPPVSSPGPPPSTGGPAPTAPAPAPATPAPRSQ